METDPGVALSHPASDGGGGDFFRYRGHRIAGCGKRLAAISALCAVRRQSLRGFFPPQERRRQDLVSHPLASVYEAGQWLLPTTPWWRKDANCSVTGATAKRWPASTGSWPKSRIIWKPWAIAAACWAHWAVLPKRWRIMNTPCRSRPGTPCCISIAAMRFAI